MSKPARLVTSLAASLCLWLASVPVQAMDPAGSVADLDSRPHAAQSTLQSNGMTLSQAVAQVQRQYGGRIISAETRRSGNREVHHVKVLTPDNKVKTVKVNGRRL